MEDKNASGKPTLSWSQPQQPQKPASVQSPKPAMSNNKSTSEEKSNMPTYAGIFVAGLVVGVLVGWGVTASRDSGDVATTATSTVKTTTAVNTSATSTKSGAVTAAVNLGTNASQTTSTGLGAVTVNSPQMAGTKVIVSSASVSAPTWIAIFDNKNGVPGNALGAMLFFPKSAGGVTSGTVELLRATVAGQTYLVGQWLDDGDKKFSKSIDKPVRDSKGNPVLIELKAN